MSLRKIVLSASSGNGCKSDKTLFGARTQEVGRKTANLMLGLLLTSTIGLAQFTGTVWENTPDASNASDPLNMASTLPSAQFVSSAIYFCSVPGGEPGCPATAGYNVGAFLNNPTFTNLQNGFNAGNNLDNTEVQLTGSIYLTAGDNNFMIGHDDGFTMQISGGPGTVTCSTQSGTLCVNVPGTSAFASTPFTITPSVAGIYDFTLNYSECCGPPAYLLFAYANGAPVGSAQIFKSFGASSIPVGGTTSLTFTVLNPNAQGNLTSVAFTDNLPVGLILAPPVNGSCGGGTFTVSLSSISLTGATLPAGASCTFSVNVQGIGVGTQNNSVTVTSNIGMGNTATASLAVEGPPSISKAFGATSIPLGGTTNLTFAVSNPAGNPLTLMGISFTDSLPAGLVVATPNGLTGSCGGGPITAVAGSSTVNLTGAALAPGVNCIFSVNVTGVAAGVDTNAVTVSSANGGTGNTATATVTVLAPPILTKVFSPSTIFQSQTSTVAFALANPNSLAITGVVFTDPLPAGLLGVAVTSNTCGGTTVLIPGSFSLSGGTIAPTSVCAVTLTVQATAGGSLVNTTSTATSTNAPAAPAATATLVVFPTQDASFQVRYAANLNLGESYINIANDGANGASLLGPGLGGTFGNICVNVYAFDPSEELVSCCSCLVTPDQTVNLGVVADLTSKTLTGVVPTSVTVKLLATLAGPNGSGTGTVCNNSAAAATTTNIVPSGLAAWGTTLHAQGTGTGTTETPFTASTLSPGELASITGRCAAIIGNASGFGICTSCRSGALGASKL